MSERDRPVMGSGNVYRDFGFPDPEGMLAKADVTSDLLRSMERQSLTNELAAEVIGITPDDLSRITRGHFEDRTLDELTGYLQALQAGEAA